MLHNLRNLYLRLDVNLFYYSQQNKVSKKTENEANLLSNVEDSPKYCLRILFRL